MRTTVDIEDSVLDAAKAIARDEGIAIGAVLSRLARKGLEGTGVVAHAGGFPVFTPAPGAAPITVDLVNEHRDGH